MECSFCCVVESIVTISASYRSQIVFHYAGFWPLLVALNNHNRIGGRNRLLVAFPAELGAISATAARGTNRPFFWRVAGIGRARIAPEVVGLGERSLQRVAAAPADGRFGRLRKAPMAVRGGGSRFATRGPAESSAPRAEALAGAMRFGRWRDNPSVRRPAFAERPGACCVHR